LDEESQKQILESQVNFQGIYVALSTLVGTDPPDSIKALLDSDVISILLSNEQELSVGRQLSFHYKYYVPRVLQHHIYLKEDILKLTDYAVTFAISGLQADELKNYLPASEKICEFVCNERERSHNFKIVSDFSKTGLSSELENMETYNEPGQNVEPEEVRYIILGNKNPDSEFRKLKELCRNVHWIHVEEGAFLWRDTNSNIDIIRRYIDNTKCEKYDDMESLVEHKDRTILLVAEPGMGKSTFLSYMAHKIKEWKTSVWVLRINLIEHTKEYEDTNFKPECIDKCKRFLWSAAHSTEQTALELTKEIFLQALEETGKMVIILDGFDEISPDYSRKVEMLIRTIRDETASKIWISSRFSYQEQLEDILGTFAFILQPFTPENQVQFLEKYWSKVPEISNQGNLEMFAKVLLNLCSKNFSDKDGDFTGIPLQTMMLGEAFVNEAKEYCCNGELNLPENFNLLDLFQRFTEKKFHIYFREKNEMDPSKPKVKREKESYLKEHMTSALIHLFSPNELKGLKGAIRTRVMKQAMKFLKSGMAEQFGIIREIRDGKPHFVHRCFAEYFAAKWFTDNFRQCEEFISNVLFNTTKEVTRNIFDRILANDSEIHVSVLNNDIHAFQKILKKKTDINTFDKGGRTALHLAASYNSLCIQQLLSFPGIHINKPDEVFKWTPLRYADRTKSWMAMDILLHNGANPYDIVFTRDKAGVQEWGQTACWECASKGRIKLLEFMLNCGLDLNAHIDVSENVNEECTLLLRGSYCGQVEVVRLIANRGADINIRDANNNTALHLAAESGSVDIIQLLLDKAISVNLTNTNGSTPLHISVHFGHLEATKSFVERGAALNKTNKYGNTPLMVAAHKGKLELFRYLTEKGADINICNFDNNTALHLASASNSVDIIKLLLDKGMSVNLPNTPGFTPLHVSARFGHLEATKALVERDAAVDRTNGYDHTPLMVAAYNDKLEICRFLIEKGADINFCNKDNNTAIRYAARSGNVDIINLLLDKGISVNLTDKRGSTPLHVSVQFGHLKATKLFCERGAAVNNTNKNGDTPIMVAAYSGKLEIFRYLREIGADINIRDANKNTALHLAAESGGVDIIKLLLDKGMSVNLTDKDDSTPLHVAAEFGHVEATKLLVGSGAAVNNTNECGRTPLMMAAYGGKLEIFRYLTETGADINIRDANKNTALHFASASGNVNIIKSLLDKGMSVNMTNTDEFTPLHISAQFGHLEATKCLVGRGAAINNTNKYGNTPLMVAVYNDKLELCHYLTVIGADINIRGTHNNC
jgi:ankyrin repeat protein